MTETWERPTGCVARDVDGDPLVHGVDEQVLPTDRERRLPRRPADGRPVRPYATDQGTPDANFGAAVDGNYGFGDGCFWPDGVDPGFDPASRAARRHDSRPLPGGGDYLVQVEIPNDA